MGELAGQIALSWWAISRSSARVSPRTRAVIARWAVGVKVQSPGIGGPPSRAGAAPSVSTRPPNRRRAATPQHGADRVAGAGDGTHASAVRPQDGHR